MKVYSVNTACDYMGENVIRIFKSNYDAILYALDLSKELYPFAVFKDVKPKSPGVVFQLEYSPYYVFVREWQVSTIARAAKVAGATGADYQPCDNDLNGAGD